MQDGDDIIKSAKESGGKMTGGPDLFVLEGNGETNDLRIIPADDSFKNNVAAFTYNIPHRYLTLGMFTTREAAEETIEVIRKLYRNENGDVITL